MERLLLNEEMKAETLPITYKIVTDWDGFPKAEVRFTEEAMNFRGGTFEILNGRVTAKHVVARKVPTKDLYEDFKYETKLWPRTVAKFLNKLGKEVREKYEEYGLIDDLDRELSRKYFYSRYLKSSSLRQYWHNRTVMRELHADDMLHMLPYYLAIKTEWTNNYRSEELTMSTVRKLMGKSMWKWALHQSYHRNSVIADVVTSRACRKLRPDQMHKLINMPVWKIRVFLEVTKYWIHEVNMVALEYLDQFVRAGRTDDELQSVFEYAVRTWVDTTRMAEDLGLRCRVKPWSENLHEVHDEYVLLKNKAKLDGLCTLSLIRDDYIKAEAEHFVKFAAELGITATVLDSEYLLAKEGAEMHHCVGSYSWDVREGECLIFSLEKDGHRSTLQLSKTRGSQGQHIGWHVGQNYAKHNTTPHESLCIRTEVHADQVKTGYLRMEAFGLA